MSYNEQRLALAALRVQIRLFRADRTLRFETTEAIPLDACLAVRLEGKEADSWITPSTSATSA
jgi:hypothetical protein